MSGSIRPSYIVEVLDFSYAGVAERSGTAPPISALEATLRGLRSRRLWLDRGAFPWIEQTVAGWAEEAGAEIRPLPKVRGSPMPTTEPLLLCVPDRVGFMPPPSWVPSPESIVVRHRFRRPGDLQTIDIDTSMTEPHSGQGGRGPRLAGRLRQIPRITVISGTHEAWCSFLQPEDPAALLASMSAEGVIGGDSLELPEFAGGIGAVVPAGAGDHDLDRYALTLARALE